MSYTPDPGTCLKAYRIALGEEQQLADYENLPPNQLCKLQEAATIGYVNEKTQEAIDQVLQQLSLSNKTGIIFNNLQWSPILPNVVLANSILNIDDYRSFVFNGVSQVSPTIPTNYTFYLQSPIANPIDSGRVYQFFNSSNTLVNPPTTGPIFTIEINIANEYFRTGSGSSSDLVQKIELNPGESVSVTFLGSLNPLSIVGLNNNVIWMINHHGGLYQ